MTSKRQACRWSSGVRHLGVAVLGVAVLGTAVLGVAVLGIAVLHPKPASIRTAFWLTPPISTTHSKRNYGVETTSMSMVSRGARYLGVAVLGVAVLGTAVGLNANTKSSRTQSVSTCAKSSHRR